jgi:hypothetical protein
LLPGECWAEQKGTYGSVKLRFDKGKGKSCGTLKVTVLWHELTSYIQRRWWVRRRTLNCIRLAKWKGVKLIVFLPQAFSEN